MTGIPPEHAILLAAILFLLGLMGVLARRNVIFILMSIEIMLNAANINFVTFASYYGDVAGQIFALFSIAIAAAEVAIGLAILLNLNRIRGTIDLSELHLLRW